MSKKKAPRGRHVQADPSNGSSSAGEWMGDNSQGYLRDIIRGRPKVLAKGSEILSMYIDRNTTFIQQKAFALHIFATAVSEDGRIMDACKTASMIT